MDDRFPAYRGKMEYVCLNCGERYPIDRLLYACPACRGVFLLEDAGFDRLKERDGAARREVLDAGFFFCFTRLFFMGFCTARAVLGARCPPRAP